MPRKKTGKHLQFYMDCMSNGVMPENGLCRCATTNLISDDDLSLYFKPYDFIENLYFWASGEKNDKQYVFTPLRQTIVLLLAAINNEL